MASTIQAIFDECENLNKQRNFILRLVVPFSFFLRSEDQRDPQDLVLGISKSSGHLFYESSHSYRPQPTGGGVSIGPLVFIPGRLTGPIVADVSVEGHGVSGETTMEYAMAVSGPVAQPGSQSTIDIYSPTRSDIFFTEFDADPSTPLPLEIVSSLPQGYKNTLVLALGQSKLVLAIPPGPIHLP
jgi:hypothetical protein